MDDETFLRRAIALSAEAAATPGSEPFGAVVVRDGAIVGEGFNRSRARHDPTSHGETEAIRDACAKLGTLDLSGCVLFSSCEPCALCVAAMEIAGIDRVVYAASLADSAAALAGVPKDRRRGGNVAALRREAGAPIGQGRMRARQTLVAEAVAVLDTWAKAPN
ncbi:nucleoside deaminase [Paracraurococcus ruber]|uniref:tRNA-specific adenosine deaminase n=1 Tax=Paracraurococcus ruber TaxID=77675 RepID=A0ABS1D401_9PROT|nr:nucleoside deaminase [Paracraurococcus ruber]MBK1661218.1 tRNA-specific adenosine deaminase [Paracraurococcus ruber]TDG24388.1 nucleoside deaminase [Paracraurococcus ruber]